MDILVADGSIRVMVRLCAAIKEAGCSMVRAELTLHPADLFNLLCQSFIWEILASLSKICRT
jgi:hypothetical protein